MPQGKETVMMAFYGRSRSLRKTIRACTYVCAWGVVKMDLGHAPTWEEYWTWWGQSPSTTARDVRAFTACVPDGVKVGDVWGLLEPSVTEKLDRDALVPLLSSTPWRFA